MAKLQPLGITAVYKLFCHIFRCKNILRPVNQLLPAKRHNIKPPVRHALLRFVAVLLVTVPVLYFLLFCFKILLHN